MARKPAPKRPSAKRPSAKRPSAKRKAAAKPPATRRKTAAPTPPAKRPPHRPPYVPTEQDRRTVESMSRWNQDQDEIARVLGIDPKTLRKHFPDEIATAYARAQDRMWRSLYVQGIGTPARKADKTKGISASVAIPPNVKATIAWLEFKGAGRPRGVTINNNNISLSLRSVDEAALRAELAEILTAPRGRRITLDAEAGD